MAELKELDDYFNAMLEVQRLRKERKNLLEELELRVELDYDFKGMGRRERDDKRMRAERLRAAREVTGKRELKVLPDLVCDKCGDTVPVPRVPGTVAYCRCGASSATLMTGFNEVGE